MTPAHRPVKRKFRACWLIYLNNDATRAAIRRRCPAAEPDDE